MTAVDDRSFGVELHRAIVRSGMTLAQVREALAERGVKVSLASLSYWQSGRSLPTRGRSLEAVRELEGVFGMSAGSLHSRLPLDAATRWDPVSHVPYTDQVQELLSLMDLWPIDRYRTIGLREHVTVSPDLLGQDETTEQLIRAKHDGLTKMALVLRLNFVDDPRPLITALAGCTLGRVVDLDEDGLLAAEIVFDRRIDEGEYHLFSYNFNWELPSPSTGDGYTRFLPEQCDYLVLGASFGHHEVTAATLQSTPFGFNGGLAAGDLTQELTPLDGGIEVTLVDPAPGTYAIEWVYASAENGDAAHGSKGGQ